MSDKRGKTTYVSDECFSWRLPAPVSGVIVNFGQSPDLFALIGKKSIQVVYSLIMAAIISPPAQKMPCLQMEGTPQSGHVARVVTARTREK